MSITSSPILMRLVGREGGEAPVELAQPRVELGGHHRHEDEVVGRRESRATTSAASVTATSTGVPASGGRSRSVLASNRPSRAARARRAPALAADLRQIVFVEAEVEAKADANVAPEIAQRCRRRFRLRRSAFGLEGNEQDLHERTILSVGRLTRDESCAGTLPLVVEE